VTLCGNESHNIYCLLHSSYPFSEDTTISNGYMEKRCPSWCDRILLNGKAMSLVSNSFLPPVYEMMAKDVCTGDHKPIYLLFDFLPSLPKATAVSPSPITLPTPPDL
jgi:inositol-1,4,5-trisphosphate 5-phosphatase